MRYGTGTEPAFDADNRAWRRFSDVASEHFDTIIWNHARDDRPVLLTLRDVQTGDMVTLAVIDSIEVREPHVLLAGSTAGELTTHGPTDGAAAAAAYGATLALDATTLAATRPAPLHDPATAVLPTGAWVDLPPGLALRPALDHARTVVLVLLDHTGGRLAVVGPFPHHATAEAWQPDDEPGRAADRLIVALHPVALSQPLS